MDAQAAAVHPSVRRIWIVHSMPRSRVSFIERSIGRLSIPKDGTPIMSQKSQKLVEVSKNPHFKTAWLVRRGERGRAGGWDVSRAIRRGLVRRSTRRPRQCQQRPDAARLLTLAMTASGATGFSARARSVRPTTVLPASARGWLHGNDRDDRAAEARGSQGSGGGEAGAATSDGMGKTPESPAQELPISIPAASTSAPPSMTFAAADTGGVCMNFHCIQAIARSSSTVTAPASAVAVQKSGIR